MRRPLLLAAHLIVAGALGSASAASDPGVTLNTSDATLVGAFDDHWFEFFVPRSWEARGAASLQLSYARSALLDPDVSTWTVELDGVPVATVALDVAPESLGARQIPLPGRLTPGRHQLVLRAYHRSHAPCERRSSPGLWSRLIQGARITIPSRALPLVPTLSDWPAPFVDPWSEERPPVVLIVPSEPTVAELDALGRLAVGLGSAVDRRGARLLVHPGAADDAPPGHRVQLHVVGGSGSVDPDLPEDPRLAPLLSGAARGAGAWVGPHPTDPKLARLVLVGSTGPDLVGVAERFARGADALFPNEPAMVWESPPSFPPATPRHWRDTFPPESTASLRDLGLRDIRAEDPSGSSVHIPLRILPDEHVNPGQARLLLRTSHASRTEERETRLRIFLNGFAMGSARPTGDTSGREALYELPSHAFGPESGISLTFSHARSPEPCAEVRRGAPVSVTVHADTEITLPRERGVSLPDLSLLRHGAYPYGIRTDLGDVTFVLPQVPGPLELQAYVWIAGELGRLKRGPGAAFALQLGFDEPAVKDRNLVVIKGPPPRPPSEVGGSLVLEQLAVPGDEPRTHLFVTAGAQGLVQEVGACGGGRAVIDRAAGRVLRARSCSDLAALPARERIRYFGGGRALFLPIYYNGDALRFGLGLLLALFVAAQSAARGLELRRLGRKPRR